MSELTNLNNNDISVASDVSVINKNINLNDNEHIVELDKTTNNFVFLCPHCNTYIEVGQNEINCTIFRHGYFFQQVNNNIILTSQLNPHASKQECDELFRQGKIYGCGKPFQLLRNGDKCIVKICDYI